MTDTQPQKVCEVNGCHRVALPETSMCWKHYKSLILDHAVKAINSGTHKLVITPCEEDPRRAIANLVRIHAQNSGGNEWSDETIPDQNRALRLQHWRECFGLETLSLTWGQPLSISSMSSERRLGFLRSIAIFRLTCLLSLLKARHRRPHLAEYLSGSCARKVQQTCVPHHFWWGTQFLTIHQIIYLIVFFFVLCYNTTGKRQSALLAGYIVFFWSFTEPKSWRGLCRASYLAPESPRQKDRPPPRLGLKIKKEITW